MLSSKSRLSTPPALPPVSSATKKLMTTNARIIPPTSKKTGEYVVKDWLVLDAIHRTMFAAPTSISGCELIKYERDRENENKSAKYTDHALPSDRNNPSSNDRIHYHTLLRMKVNSESITYPTRKLPKKDTSGKNTRSEKLIYHRVFLRRRRRTPLSDASFLCDRARARRTRRAVAISIRKGKKRSALRRRSLTAVPLYQSSLRSAASMWIRSSCWRRSDSYCSL